MTGQSALCLCACGVGDCRGGNWSGVHAPVLHLLLLWFCVLALVTPVTALGCRASAVPEPVIMACGSSL